MTEEEVVVVEEEEEEEEVLLSTLTLGSSSRLRFPSPSIVDDVVGIVVVLGWESTVLGGVSDKKKSVVVFVGREGQRSKSRMTLNWVENKRLEQCDNRDD
jgi:hypothetical protein